MGVDIINKFNANEVFGMDTIGDACFGPLDKHTWTSTRAPNS